MVATVSGDLVVLDVGGESRSVSAEALGSEVQFVAIRANGLVAAAELARAQG